MPSKQAHVYQTHGLAPRKATVLDCSSSEGLPRETFCLNTFLSTPFLHYKR